MFFESENARNKAQRDPYMAGAQDARFAALAEAVPQDAELGYLSDAEAGSVLAQTLLYGAQYALAPRLVRDGAGPLWTLGNFTRPLDYAAFGAPHGLKVERDFGNGVVLFRKERS